MGTATGCSATGLYQESELGSPCLVSARRVRVMSLAMPRYAELEVTTNFSFLRGGSHPEELVATAKALGLEAIAVTDRNTLAGVVRAHLAAKEVGIKFIVGARLDLKDAPSLLAYPTRPRRLRPALPAAHARPAPRREGAMHALSR